MSLTLRQQIVQHGIDNQIDTEITHVIAAALTTDASIETILSESTLEHTDDRALAAAIVIVLRLPVERSYISTLIAAITTHDSVDAILDRLYLPHGYDRACARVYAHVARDAHKRQHTRWARES